MGGRSADQGKVQNMPDFKAIDEALEKVEIFTFGDALCDAKTNDTIFTEKTLNKNYKFAGVFTEYVDDAQKEEIQEHINRMFDVRTLSNTSSYLISQDFYSCEIMDVLNKNEILVTQPYTDASGVVAAFTDRAYTSTFSYVEGASNIASALTGSFAKIKLTDSPENKRVNLTPLPSLQDKYLDSINDDVYIKPLEIYEDNKQNNSQSIQQLESDETN